MSQKQIELELEASRAATEKIRRDLQKARDKGYFSNQPFVRDFLRKYTLPFSEALQAAVQKTSIGRATTTNIALIYKEMDLIMNYSSPDSLAFISLKSIFDATGVRKYDKPKMQDICGFIGTRIEQQVELDYYTRIADENVVKAMNKELNTKGSGLKNRQYGAVYTAKELLKKMGWSDDDLFPKWSNYNRYLVGSFVLEIATRQGYTTYEKKSLEVNKKATFIDLAPEIKAQFLKYQTQLEEYSILNWPLIDKPKDWIYQPGLSKLNHTGGYHSEWIRKCGNRRLCRNNYNSVFGEDAIELLNIQQKTAWTINHDIYKVAERCLERGFSIGKLAAHLRHPLLDQPMPDHLVALPKDDPDRKAWKKEKAAAYSRNTELEKKAHRSVRAITQAEKFLTYPRFYLSWSCDYQAGCIHSRPFYSLKQVTTRKLCLPLLTGAS